MTTALYAAICHEPNRLLSHYRVKLGLGPGEALEQCGALIAQGKIKRNYNTEKLMPTEIPALAQLPNEHDVMRERIVELLRAGDKSTNELAELLGRTSVSIGPMLAKINRDGAIRADRTKQPIVWSLRIGTNSADRAADIAAPTTVAELVKKHAEPAVPPAPVPPAAPAGEIADEIAALQQRLHRTPPQVHWAPLLRDLQSIVSGNLGAELGAISTYLETLA